MWFPLRLHFDSFGTAYCKFFFVLPYWYKPVICSCFMLFPSFLHPGAMVRPVCVRWATIFLPVLLLRWPLTLTPSISAPRTTPCWGVFVTQGDGRCCSAQKFKFQTIEDAVRYADTWTMRGREFKGESISSEWIEDDPEMEYNLVRGGEDVVYYRFVLADGTNDLLTGDYLFDGYGYALRIYIKPIDPTLYPWGDIF